MVKQLFPSKKVANPLSVEDLEKAKADLELEHAFKDMTENEGDDKVRPLFDQKEAKKWKEASKEELIHDVEDQFDDLRWLSKSVKPVKVAEWSHPQQQLQHGKVMFQDKAIIDSVDDLPSSIQHHPAVQGMNNRNIRRAYFLAADMKITDTTALFKHGDARRELFTDVVNQIVEVAKNGSIAKANNAVTDIISAMKTADIRSLLKTEKQSWFHGLFHSEEAAPLGHANDWFVDATKTIDDKLIEVDAIVTSLVSRLEQLDKLYNKNKDSFELLQIEIAAGKFFCDATDTEIANAEGATDAFAASEAAYHKMTLEQFKNKIVDLEAVAQSVLTNAPQIRMLQLNIQGLSERIKTIRLVYARWKTQFVFIVQSLETGYAKRINSDPKDLVKYADQQFSSELAEFSAIQASLQ